MKKILHIFDNIEEYLCGSMMAIMALVVFLQVVYRFVLKSSLPWSEEVSRYLLVWITFIGASSGVKHGSHIGVEALLLILPKKLKKFVNLGSIAICIFFCSVVSVFSLKIIAKQMELAQVSPAMQIPIWWAYLAIPVGTILMSIRYIQVAITIYHHKNIIVEGDLI